MQITDLNEQGAHVYRKIMEDLHNASLRLTPDQMTALLEYFNQEMSEACMAVHNGADPKRHLFAMRITSAASVNGGHYTRPIHPAPLPGVPPLVPAIGPADDWQHAGRVSREPSEF